MPSIDSNITSYRLFLVKALERAHEGEHLNQILSDAPSDDYGLCQEILYGITRWQGTLTKLIRTRAKKNPKLGVRRILYLALYELHWLNKPPHAVIDQAVRICKAGKYHQQARFVNALLRQIEPPKDLNPADNFPDWLQSLWAAYPQWLSSLQEAPNKTLVYQSSPNDTPMECVPATVNGVALDKVYHYTNSGKVTEIDGYAEGEWWIMNPAATRVVDIVWELVISLNGNKTQRVLDLCAAPGGKTFRFITNGADVTAVDWHDVRIARMQENLRRLKMTASVLKKDLMLYHEDIGTYDVVFLDAPCSGLGVVRKHPEIRWNRTEADIISAALRQRQILSHAKQYVGESGLLAYCICSLHPMEGPMVVEHFLNDNPDWVLLNEWRTPIDSEHTFVEKLDGFQLYILQKRGVHHV